MFRFAITERPDHSAITCEGRHFTYAEYGGCVAGLASVLSNLSVTGERVAILLPNSPEMAFSIYAALLAGAQATLFNPNYPEPELRPILRDADPKVIITKDSLADQITSIASGLITNDTFVFSDDDPSLVETWRKDHSLTLPEIPIKPESLATLLYTGGTTGVSKGVNRTHDELMIQIRAMEVSWPTRVDTEVWLNVAPMFHTYGFLMGCISPVYGRAHLVMIPQFKPEPVVEALDRYKVTVFAGGPPALYNGLLGAENLESADLSHLRTCAAGASPFPAAIHDRWAKRTGVRTYEAYGMTELSPITVNRPGSKQKIGSVGKVAPLLDLEIVDLVDGTRALAAGVEGEIRVRGPQAFKSYRNRPDETAATIRDGWVYTGDIGYLDEEGYLFIVDRKKDMIIVSGYNVFPREIDEVLVQHPDVQEVGTVGIPDERKGEVPASFVVPVSEKSPDLDVLLDMCHKHLVAYKIPKSIRLIDKLPKTAAHKLDRKLLRDIAAADRE